MTEVNELRALLSLADRESNIEIMQALLRAVIRQLIKHEERLEWLDEFRNRTAAMMGDLP